MVAVQEKPADTGRRDDERYQRLMAAARKAAREGYDAVSMRALAESTRMSLTTVYQFCSSKDRLIAEAHLERMEELRARLVRHPPRGRTARSRVLKVVHMMVDEVEADEELTYTLMRAVYSLDPSVGEVRTQLGVTFTDFVDAAIGDVDVPDRAASISTLGNVIGGVVFEWLRHRDVARLRRSLEDAVRVVFR